ncbi:MAG TPA: CxxC-x17-CxxC domain-containing protein [Planctomycetota bacterium]|nr:CxxC-x17-CxxC domain-containing protein [Planctomycetota bacterium]
MSTFTDKTLKCIECGQDFTYTVAEQELHQSLGYQNEPKRCTPCREAKRQRKAPAAGGSASGDRPPRGGGGGAPRGGGGGGGGAPAREYFMAICGECGKEAQLPFKPRGDRPVFCSDCFSKRRTPM